VVVTTDKGLCGGLNTNVLRAVTVKLKELDAQGIKAESVAIGNKGLGFLNRVGVKVVSQATHLGDKPHLEKLIGPVKVLLDAYAAGKLKAVYLCYTRFINTMKQEPVVQQLLPLSSESLVADKGGPGWDYIYEPDAQAVIDELLVRYVEALVYQATAENMASEQSARMVAMKSATDNAGSSSSSTTRRARRRSPKSFPKSSPALPLSSRTHPDSSTQNLKFKGHEHG
jgi:F-type H+-transporting ATPase subunit gamma